MTHVGVEGVCFLADCLRSMQKWPVVGSSFGWLSYVPLDVYVSILSLLYILEGNLGAWLSPAGNGRNEFQFDVLHFFSEVAEMFSK